MSSISNSPSSQSLLREEKRLLLDSFVKRMDGKRTIQRILVANNGMAATKAILSMRQWAYMVLGDERAIEFVAMATRDDLNANAEFIRLADTFVEVPSGSNKVSNFSLLLLLLLLLSI
jgi:acetyl-CoA carboxylase/biotin carboxylase 1